MAVDLPPPIPPQQGGVERIRQGGAFTEFAAHEYQVHVFGQHLLDAAGTAKALREADTISNGLRALVTACYAAGYPGARLTYALSGHDLYVRVTLDGIKAVEGGGPVEKYFDGLDPEEPLTAADLEPRRVLAGMHADRAGLAVKTRLVPDAEAGHATLALDAGADAPRSTHATLEYGNPGNRFVGRNFADLDLVTGTRWGDQLHSFTRTTAGTGGETANHGNFRQQDLGWNRVTTWGIFGIGGRYVAYDFDTVAANPAPPPNTVTNTYSGKLKTGEVTWQLPVLADFDSRLTTLVKVDRTDKTTDQAPTPAHVAPLAPGPRVQQELYTSGELALAWQQAADWRGHRWDFESALVGRKGFGEGKAPDLAATPLPPSPVVPPDLDYRLYRAAFVARYHFAGDATLSLELGGQYSPDAVPEQQQLVLGGFATTAVPGVATGDTGGTARFTINAGAHRALGLAWQPKAFVDYGVARLNQDPAPTGTCPAGQASCTQSLADAGVELDLARGKWFEAAVAYAQAIADGGIPETTLDAADANAYFSVKFKY